MAELKQQWDSIFNRKQQFKMRQFAEFFRQLILN